MEGNDPGKKCINMAGIKQTSHFKQNHFDMSHINEADDIGVRSQPVSPADQMIHNILRGSLATNWNGNGR